MSPCGPSGPSCVDADGDTYYGDTATCDPPEGQIDCDDTDPAKHPGYYNEDCDDFGQDDENCNGYSNCRDAWCLESYGSACDEECDKDDDDHLWSECEGGDDCKDDPEVFPHAAEIHNGSVEDDEDLCSDGWSNDCDDLPDCEDPDCADWCEEPGGGGGGGGGEPQTRPAEPYCGGGQTVTVWEISYDSGETWGYYYTDYVPGCPPWLD